MSDGTAPAVTSSCAFVSSDTRVATVSSTGLITAICPGSATVTATYQGKIVQIPVAVNCSILNPAVTIDLSTQEGISVTLDRGNSVPMKAIRNGSTALSLGTDYTAVYANSPVITQSYLATLPLGTTTLTFDFDTGNSATLKITVGDSAAHDSSISPVAAIFDTYSGASQNNETSVTLSLNGNTLTDIKNGATYSLVEGADYTIAGNVVTFSKTYLERCDSNTAMPFVFSGGKTTTTAVFKLGVVSNVKDIALPKGITIDSSGNVYIIDAYKYRVLEVPAKTGTQWGMDMEAGGTYVVASGVGLQQNSSDGAKPLLPAFTALKVYPWIKPATFILQTIQIGFLWYL